MLTWPIRTALLILFGSLLLLLSVRDSRADTVFLYSSGRDIHGVNLEQDSESRLTTAGQAGNVNALAANADQGLIYYGDGTRAYLWDPSLGSAAAAHTLLTDFASGPVTAPIRNINSTGGSYLAGNWYVASEDNSGFIEEIWRIGLSADGRQALSATPLGLLAACGCSSVQLGGFGDIAARLEGGAVIIYGSSADLTGSQGLGTSAGRWRFDAQGGLWQWIGAGNGGQLSNSLDGRLYTNTGTTVRELDPVNGSTGPGLYTTDNDIWDFTSGFAWDFGDAPASYGTAIHAIGVNNTSSPILGQLPPDNDYFTLNADSGLVAGAGDDSSGADDEDALGLIAPIESTSNNYTVTVQCSTGSKVSAWLDIDADGQFSLAERNSNYPTNCGSGSVELRWNSLNGISIISGTRYLRIRTASELSMIEQPYGFAADGEVEDYPITVSNAQAGSCPAGQVSTQYASTDLPLSIGPGRRKVTRSVIPVTTADTVLDVNVLNVEGSHSWMSDLRFDLNHDNVGVTLFGPACGSTDDFFFSFDDEAAGTPPCPPIDGGTYPPSGSLASFDGMNALGDWTLQVTDLYNGDGGQLVNWVLEICTAPVIVESPDVRLGKTVTVSGSTATFSLSVVNSGDVALSDLQIVDDLDIAFGSGNHQLSSPPVLSGAPAGFAANTAYTGVSANSELLSAVSLLQPGERIDIAFSVLVSDPLAGTQPGEFLNQASVSARSPAGVTVFDLSGDGASLEVDSDTPTPVVLDASLRLSGQVFEDSSATTSGNHDSIRQAAETPLAAQRIEVRHGNDGTLLDTALSNAEGYWEVRLPVALAGLPVDVMYRADSTYAVVSEAAAFSGGSILDGVMRIDALGLQHYDGLDMGLVASPSLEVAAVTSAPPGTRLSIPHTYRASSSGTLVFSLSPVSNPTSPLWPATLIGDANCNGERDDSETAVPLSLAVSHDQRVCIVLEVFVPASVPAGARWQADIRADLELSPWAAAEEAPQQSVQLVDRVTVSAGQGRLVLEKQVRNLSRAESAATSNRALPGDVLEYTLGFRNTGSGPLTDLTVNDQTPAFTALDAASLSCDQVPASLSCTPGVSGDALTWAFSGVLAAGEGGSLSYRVTVE